MSLDFAAFFHAVHGVTPLPWQERLAEELTTHHAWPELIDLPTASGKTACLDIALFHLAFCATLGTPGLAARRIVFVVDRRIIVDAAYERAEKIRCALQSSRDASIRAVADALSGLSAGPALMCQKLRGGVPRERGFTHDPTQPMVLTSTVDQIGSRLLFRGYGLSSYSYSLHAGLLGHDTLILLDEAHLSVPFAETVAAVRREQARADCPLSSVRPVQLVSLSATARATGEPFQLSAADLRHPVIHQRRTAPKPARLIPVGAKPAERLKALVSETLSMAAAIESQAPAIAVIVNRVKTARDLFEALQAKAGETFDIRLMIGRSRPLERDALAGELLNRVAAGRAAADEDRPFIVVATQTIEVGADLDFQGLITECAALDALRQRFGRLDRLGSFRAARAAILGDEESGDDPIYGAALRNTWLWLNRIAESGANGKIVDFSIEKVDAALAGQALTTLLGKPKEYLQLTPAHVELLCQTSPQPLYDPDVSALLHGFESAQPDVQVIWREALPTRSVNDKEIIDERESELVNRMLTLLPPSVLETLAIPLAAAKSWLSTLKAASDLSDLEGVAAEEEAAPVAKNTRSAWVRRHERWQRASSADLRPGDTLVVPIDYGGCDRFGFAPHSEEPVRDLTQAARERLQRERIRLITEKNSIADAEVWRQIRAEYASDEDNASDWAALLGETEDAGRPTVELLTDSQEALYGLVLRGGAYGDEDISDEEDISASFTTPVALSAHNAGVGRRARNLAERLGLEPAQCATLGGAGDVHDIGKADPRFQTLLRAGDTETLSGELLAKGLRGKSPRRVVLGERHEAYSVAVLQSFPEMLSAVPDCELALHLVGTHHGRGRGLMPVVESDSGVTLQFRHQDKSYTYEGAPRLGALSSDWAERFWRLTKRYGPWGLAYLEAVLRLADHLQSRAELEGR